MPCRRETDPVLVVWSTSDIPIIHTTRIEHDAPAGQICISAKEGTCLSDTMRKGDALCLGT